MRNLLRLLTCLGLGLHLSAAAETTLFEVSRSDKPGRSLFLGGSIHLLRQSDFPLPPEFDAALNQSAQLVLESDLNPARQAELGQKIMAMQQMGNGESLETTLSPKVWNKLQAYCNLNQIPLEQLRHTRPFFLSMVLTMQRLQRMGFVPGVDHYLDQQARTQGKAIGQLESTEQILAMMQSLDSLNADEVIQSTLDDMSRIESMFAGLVASWRTGDLSVIQKEMVTPMQEQFPLVYKMLLVARNMSWLPQIEAHFASAGTELIVVGSAHLVGPDGLISQLIKRGYRVAQVQAPTSLKPPAKAKLLIPSSSSTAPAQ